MHLYFLFLFFGLKYEEEEFSFKLHDLDFIIGFDFAQNYIVYRARVAQ
jgi:hypothetical protein